MVVEIRKVGAKQLPWLTTDLIHKKRDIKFLNREARTTNTLMHGLSTKREKNNTIGK